MDSFIPSSFTDAANNKYYTRNMTYPKDIEGQLYGSTDTGTVGNGSQFGNKKVVFFINVSVGSKSIPAGANSADDIRVYELPPGETGTFSGQQVATALADSLKATEGGAISNQITSQILSGKMMRLDTCICLHMPRDISNEYGVQWSEADDDEMRNAQFAGTLATKALDVIKGGSAADNAAGAGDAAAAFGASKIIGKMQYIQKATRTTPGNSKQEQLFRGVDYRTFNFNYSFAPRDEEEAMNVINIIRMFKYHMLPEFKDSNNFMYLYPSEFLIKFFDGAKENEFLAKYTTAVLTNMRVDYTPNGQYNTFANGMPQQINVTLSFKELAKASKETSPWNANGL